MPSSGIFLIASLLLNIVSYAQNKKTETDFKTYCNARFGYCIDYPSNLYPQKESANGDGCVFINEKEEEVLRVYGKNNIEPGTKRSLQKQFREILKESGTNGSVTFKKLGENFFVISGRKQGKIFYQKTTQKGDIFVYAILEYNENDKESYDKLSKKIVESLR